jgi:hypothetical protein
MVEGREKSKIKSQRAGERSNAQLVNPSVASVEFHKRV